MASGDVERSSGPVLGFGANFQGRLGTGDMKPCLRPVGMQGRVFFLFFFFCKAGGKPVSRWALMFGCRLGGCGLRVVSKTVRSGKCDIVV